MRIQDNMNIYSSIKNNVLICPAKTLLSVDDEDVTYAEFIDSVDLIAAALVEMGIGKDEKIGIVIPNSVVWYSIYLGIVKTGAQPVPFDPQIGQWEMIRLLTLCDIKICFIASKYRSNNILSNINKARKKVPCLESIILVDKATEKDGILTLESFKSMAFKQLKQYSESSIEQPDVLMLACTSGSTGNPKIISVEHRGFCKSQYDMANYLKFNDSDKMLLGMPLYHQGGFGMGLQMVLNRGAIYYQSTFDPIKFLEIIQKEKITVVQLTSTLAKIILSVPDLHMYDLSSVRMCYFAGEVLPNLIVRTICEELNIRVVNIIGSTETATMLVWDSLHDRDVDVNNFRTLPFTDIRILDEEGNETAIEEIGTIFIHTDALLKEYYKNSSETSARICYYNGKKWFNTGDLGMKLSDGRIRFIGRAKRIIKRGANLICPEEIEGFLLTHPMIEAVAVVHEKHDLIGEMIVAHIQPRAGSTITRGDIVKFCIGHLAAYKIPDKVVVCEHIPHDIGKIQFKYIK